MRVLSGECHCVMSKCGVSILIIVIMAIGVMVYGMIHNGVMMKVSALIDHSGKCIDAVYLSAELHYSE
jgi:hypothetical protein